MPSRQIRDVEAGTDISLEAGQNINGTAGQSMVLEAQDSISIKCGDSTIAISPDTIDIQSPNVTINGVMTLGIDSPAMTITSAAGTLTFDGGDVLATGKSLVGHVHIGNLGFPTTPPV